MSLKDFWGVVVHPAETKAQVIATAKEIAKNEVVTEVKKIVTPEMVSLAVAVVIGIACLPRKPKAIATITNNYYIYGGELNM